MQNTLQEGEYVLIDKLTPRFDDYSRGDIVVFRPQEGEGENGDTPFIKRVIGVPGDTVEIHDGAVFVNGIELDETAYTYEGEPTLPSGDLDRWEVAEGMLFVLGDHRNNSTDSRSPTIGPIPVSSVIGRAWLRYWPITALGILETPRYPDLERASRDSSAPLERTPWTRTLAGPRVARAA
jgi:signal peptidase I